MAIYENTNLLEDYVSFETAKLLKEKGFTANIHGMYDHDGKFCEATFTDVEPYYSCYAPTLQMAMKWLREVHKLHVDVDPSEGDWNPTVITLEDWTCAEKFGDNIPIQNTYEEACEAAIKYCLENLI